ncbi:hypothetical protein BCR33DRAFT_720777 [Rhizoclosmatium globosum]|uniref:AN1-type domain-containing protein n=1 Tax=Rhizoclosmatium globosum TaxID=329046 RepID=A0A1Y2BUH3_9FUNG|nr:hypothetical protein BCR33DRAFT_720777 [Rhizoclosmatium globosum]|eukprot:ORY38410.1 hypothetical protein BCR33DRAFT_720777 [Rhizoclosmatium globosum]
MDGPATPPPSPTGSPTPASPRIGKKKCYICTDRAIRSIGDCKLCQKSFCSKHRLPESHSCEHVELLRSNSKSKNEKLLMDGKTVDRKVASI